MENDMILIASCVSYIGAGRANNEDNFYFNKKRLAEKNNGMTAPISQQTGLKNPVGFAVFDGIGGASYGEKASYSAAEIFAENMDRLNDLIIPEREFLVEICNQANEKIVSLAHNKQISQTGTTLVSFLFSENGVFTCNVGDSKAFLIRKNKIMQVSKDHTDKDFLDSIGINKKPSLLQYIGISDKEGELDPFISKGQVMKGDVFILCSDGVTDVISANDLYNTIKENSDVSSGVNAILDMIKQRCGQDNATIIVIKVS
nr:PP2C family serine/threonine-protein phosphatase [Ruminococcus sp.]